MLEEEVAVGAKSTSTWSHRSVRPRPPRGRRGDSGCGLHSGGGADEATGRTGTYNRSVTCTERIGEFGGVAWGGSVVNKRLLIAINIRALGASYMVISCIFYTNSLHFKLMSKH